MTEFEPLDGDRIMKRMIARIVMSHLIRQDINYDLALDAVDIDASMIGEFEQAITGARSLMREMAAALAALLE